MKADQRVVQQWRDLRGMLIRQLDQFEAGQLIQKTAGVDVSEKAIADLKRRIMDFEALILADEAKEAADPERS